VNRGFKRFIDSLEPAFKQLVDMKPVRADALPPDTPRAGIYLFSERGRHLYVGRTNRLQARLLEHGRESSSHNSAPFAFRLARPATGRDKRRHQPSGSRADLERDPAFRKEFLRQKRRVRKMDVRYVEERNARRQALLEIYVAVVLKTPHNQFETH